MHTRQELDAVTWARVQTFTARSEFGNQAVVCLADVWPDAAKMQAVAAEQGCSATAFVVPAQGIDVYGIQWFAPSAPIQLCGHATLAAAHVLFQSPGQSTSAGGSQQHQGSADAARVLTFLSPHYTLTAVQAGLGVTLALPWHDAMLRTEVPPVLAACCDAIVEAYYGNDTWILLLHDAAAVAAYQPDLVGLRQEGLFLAVTAAGETCDYVLRYFAPAAGTDEDPVTGSVHCVLGPLWAARVGKQTLQAHQCSPQQGWCTVSVDAAARRVHVNGQAVVTGQGCLPLAALRGLK